MVLKRRGVLLFAPLLYISGMLLYMGSLVFDVDLILENGGRGGVGVVLGKWSPPGSVYRSPQVFERLWPRIQLSEINNGTRNVLMTA